MPVPTVAFCSTEWQRIISYIANVQAKASELSIKAEGLRESIFNGLFTPGVISPELLTQVLTSQEHIESDLAVNVNIEEKLMKAVEDATAAYLKADKS